ncbi:hypothetical protein [Evansella cellulosilytica]|uniref:Uncharacterized protein n=1 Tax=Evansella cellulosilytica (strain ATCC 21833 / DSM 2522 / FERM P-1141 / JCM 9156 / N-4) TaxID=649639 RepID=E6TYP6_EVAC2|nr:hypothetical protein [Evansella cellulosilytica]ADU30096.1 hypothetical protein Bcell_1834 [Evansella cellulosilytica DSM 2522]
MSEFPPRNEAKNRKKKHKLNTDNVESVLEYKQEEVEASQLPPRSQRKTVGKRTEHKIRKKEISKEKKRLSLVKILFILFFLLVLLIVSYSLFIY